MPERDLAALDSYQLTPRLLHHVEQVSAHCRILERDWTSPIIPLIDVPLTLSDTSASLVLVSAEVLLEHPEMLDHQLSIPLLKPQKMGVLMPQVRELVAKGVPALTLDLTPLADTPPFGAQRWRPRTREDLAELRAAAGVPVWLYGVCSIADAEVAGEAGLEAIVVNSAAGTYINGPASAEVFPEIFDAVAGTLAVYAGGPVRSGIDVFRYLAIGAEAVVVESDRALGGLQAELEYAMRLTGCETLADIGYEAIFAPLFKEE